MLTEHYSGYQIQNMRCAECGTFGREERSIPEFGGETLRSERERERDYLEDPVVGG